MHFFCITSVREFRSMKLADNMVGSFPRYKLHLCKDIFNILTITFYICVLIVYSSILTMRLVKQLTQNRPSVREVLFCNIILFFSVLSIALFSNNWSPSCMDFIVSWLFDRFLVGIPLRWFYNFIGRDFLTVRDILHHVYALNIHFWFFS